MNLVSNYKTDFRRCCLCRSLKTKLLEQLATLYIGRHRYVKAGSGTSIGNYRGLKAPATSKKGGGERLSVVPLTCERYMCRQLKRIQVAVLISASTKTNENLSVTPKDNVASCLKLIQIYSSVNLKQLSRPL